MDHIKAPWKLVKLKGFRRFRLYVLDAADDVITFFYDGEEEKASLVAAAPTLLDQLEKICDQAESWHTMHDHDGMGCVPCDSICALIPTMKAAIAEARGIR